MARWICAFLMMLMPMCGYTADGYKLVKYDTWSILITDLNSMFMETKSGSKQNLIECRGGNWIVGGMFEDGYFNSDDDPTIVIVIDDTTYKIPKDNIERKFLWDVLKSPTSISISIKSEKHGTTPAIAIHSLKQYLNMTKFDKSNCYKNE